MMVFLHILFSYLLIGVFLMALGQLQAYRKGIKSFGPAEAITVVVAYPILAWLIYQDYRSGDL